MILTFFFFFRSVAQAIFQGVAKRAIAARFRAAYFLSRVRDDVNCRPRPVLYCKERRGTLRSNWPFMALRGIPYTGVLGSSVPNAIAGLSQWYDAADTSTIVGSPVSMWRDKSGNGFHLIQPTVAQRPTTGTIVHTQNTITFAGNNGASSQWMYANGVINKPNTVFVVFKGLTGNWPDWTGVICARASSSDKVTASAHDVGVYGKTSDSKVYTTATGVSVRSDGLLGSVSNFNNYNVGQGFLSNLNTVAHLLTYTDDLASYGVNNYVVGADPFSAVGSRHANMNLCEVITYNRALSSIEIGNVETYLILKWIFVGGGGD